ncbi:MAG: hypothetical protein RLZZ546_3328 [Bacteroidota bacterium]
MMTLKNRISTLVQLGQYIKEKDTSLLKMMEEAYIYNPWFSIKNLHSALEGIEKNFLNIDAIDNWVAKYNVIENQKKVGLILAGNIPAVGFHDILCCFIAGHKSLIKFSEKDRIIIPHLLNVLQKISAHTSEYFEEVDRLKDFDAVIATGSDNSARYFESYFGKYPHIIRRNRNGIAILEGNETHEELLKLGEDIFQYFGLGCRNVSKIFIPNDYNFTPLLEALHQFNEIVYHNKYKNNFDYNIALYLINKLKYLNNGSVILLEDSRYASRIATVHYEYYLNLEILEKKLENEAHMVQCVVSKAKLKNFKTFNFGAAQNPAIDDYADNVDTMKFLTEVSKN